MNEFIVYQSFDDGKTLEVAGYEKLDENGNYTYARVGRDVYQLGMITDNQGNARFYRFPYIGKTDIEGNKIYADSSIVELNFKPRFDIETTEYVIGFFTFCTKELRYVIKVLNKHLFDTLYYDEYTILNLKIIDTLQENKLELLEK